MQDIKVSFTAIGQLSSDMTARNNQILSELDTLENKAKTLRSGWDGEASMAFDAAKRDWDAETANMTGLLAQLSADVGAAGEKYMATEAKNANLFLERP